MISFSIVELNSRFEIDRSQLHKDLYGRSNQSMGFMVMSSTSSFGSKKTSAKDITKAIIDGTYGVKAKYVIYFLYDCISDGDSANFITEYGGKLHDMTSGRIAILTYFDHFMVKKWGEVEHEEMVTYDPDGSEWDSKQLMIDLQNHYKVKNLPAIVIARQDSNGKELYCKKEIKRDNKEVMFNAFKSIIQEILMNFDDFDVIQRAINIQKGESGRTEDFLKNNTTRFLNDLRNDRKKKVGFGLTREDLANGIGTDPKNIFNNLGKLERDWCFNIAIQYELSIEKLNELLALNGHSPINDLKGREEIIANCLLEKRDVYETDQILKDKGYKGIIEVPKEKKHCKDEDDE